MLKRKAVFDMGAWIQDPSPLTPHMRGASPLALVSLEPGRWGLQVAPLKSVRFRQSGGGLVGDGMYATLTQLADPLGRRCCLV